MRAVRPGVNDRSRSITNGDAGRRSDTVRVQFDRTATPPTSAVVDAVATAVDTDVLELPPLYYHIDTDALDALFADAQRSSGRSGQLTFTYADCLVTVSDDGEVAVEPPRVT